MKTAAPAPTIKFDGGVCRIAGVLDFTTASVALESVQELIESNPKLEVNLSGVTQSNSAGLALMIEWLSVARRENHVVTFSDIPDGLQQLADVCEVDGLIGLQRH